MNSDNSVPRKPLRLWPGIAIAIVQLLVMFLGPVVAPDAPVPVGMLGGVVGALLIFLWWLLLSRARWSVTWFTSRTDPLGDLTASRALATDSEAVKANVRALAFPYLNAGPQAVNLNTEPNEPGPGAAHFGMIATAKFKLPVGKWRFHTSGAGGVRVLIDGTPALENWTTDAPTEKSGDFETTTAGEVEITVEHFVVTPVPGFLFLIAPADN